MDNKLDSFDLSIIRALSENGRMSITDLSSRIGLSKTPCQQRVKRLQSDGFILGYRAILNAAKLGQNHVAFVEVKLGTTTEGALKAFNSAVQSIPEIEECHMIAGSFDYLLKVRTANIEGYRAVLGETISSLPHVSSSSTHVSMQAVKDTAF